MTRGSGVLASLAVLITVAGALGCAGPRYVTAHTQEVRGVRVEASWVSEEGQFGMMLKLTNLTGRTLEVPHSALWRGNMLLLVADAKSGRAYEETFYFDDLPAGSSSVAPGSSVERLVPLSSRFPQLLDLGPEISVVVLWSVRVPDGAAGERATGFLEVAPGAP